MKLPGLPALFLTGAALLVIIGMVSRLLISDNTIDIHLHDTYLIIAHFHIAVLAASFMVLFAGVYYFFPRIFKRRIYRIPGIVHFAITLACLVIIVWPAQYDGIAGTPRRYYDYSSYRMNEFTSSGIFMQAVITLCFYAQVLFLFNLVVSPLAGKRIEKKS